MGLIQNFHIPTPKKRTLSCSEIEILKNRLGFPVINPSLHGRAYMHTRQRNFTAKISFYANSTAKFTANYYTQKIRVRYTQDSMSVKEQDPLILDVKSPIIG